MKMATLRLSMADRIKRARKAAGLQQQELANAVGLTRTSISNIERGTQGLSIDLLYTISLHLNEDADVLLRDAINYAENTVDAELVRKRVANPKAADEIINIIKRS
jgi:transcriptional regulator with XRE-family HTH domain